jgi:hypothetical protein
VNGAVGSAIWIDPGGIVWQVLWPIPPIDRKIDPACERQGIIDANDLLVMRCVDRVPGIKLHLHARMILPGRPEQERRHRSGGVSDGEAPHENADLKFRVCLNERAQQFADRRRLRSVDIGPQPNAPVEIPADN